MAELRWCSLVDGEMVVYSPPTATDALEYADDKLKDNEEANCCNTDMRVEGFFNIRKLLGI